MDGILEENISVYPGKFIKNEEKNKNHNITDSSNTINYNKPTHIYISEKYAIKKVIVFDLDETIGSFSDFYILWSTIDNYIKEEDRNKSISDFIEFNDLLNLYPEFFRHGILHILDFIYHKKIAKLCSKIYLYTNNNILLRNKENKQNSSPTKWVSYIVDFLTKKICRQSDIPLFDKLICAFKINKKQIELKRTTNYKTHSDFIKCTVLPKRTEICFIDDTFYPGMATDKVYYIQPKAYVHYLQPDEIINRFLSSQFFMKLPQEFHSDIEAELYDCFGYSNKSIITKQQIDNDIFISRKLMYYIREFFFLTSKKQKTRKVKISPNSFTRKSYNNSIES